MGSKLDNIINDMNTNLSPEESSMVDSIINDLNSGGKNNMYGGGGGGPNIPPHLTPEEKADENYRFSEIVKNETKEMDDDEKIKIVKHIFKLDDNFPKTESTNFLKYNELEFFESNSSDKSNCFFNSSIIYSTSKTQ